MPQARLVFRYCSENSPEKPKIKPKTAKYHYAQRKTRAADVNFLGFPCEYQPKTLKIDIFG